MCLQVSVENKEDVEFPRTGVTGSCLASYVGGYWELNPGPLQEQQVLLTVEPFLQP